MRPLTKGIRQRLVIAAYDRSAFFDANFTLMKACTSQITLPLLCPGKRVERLVHEIWSSHPEPSAQLLKQFRVTCAVPIIRSAQKNSCRYYRGRRRFRTLSAALSARLLSQHDVGNFAGGLRCMVHVVMDHCLLCGSFPLPRTSCAATF